MLGPALARQVELLCNGHMHLLHDMARSRFPKEWPSPILFLNIDPIPNRPSQGKRQQPLKGVIDGEGRRIGIHIPARARRLTRMLNSTCKSYAIRMNYNCCRSERNKVREEREKRTALMGTGESRGSGAGI